MIRSPLEVDAFASARHTTENERAAILADLRVPDDRPILLTAGLLEPRKRTAWLVKALLPLLSARTVRLVIAGEGRECAAIENVVATEGLDGIHLVGHVTAMPHLLAASRVLVHSSQAEGVSQVVLQAVLAGVPVVATEVTGLREVADAPIWEVPALGEGFSAAVVEALSGRPTRSLSLRSNPGDQPQSGWRTNSSLRTSRPKVYPPLKRASGCHGCRRRDHASACCRSGSGILAATNTQAAIHAPIIKAWAHGDESP